MSKANRLKILTYTDWNIHILSNFVIKRDTKRRTDFGLWKQIEQDEHETNKVISVASSRRTLGYLDYWNTL